MRRSREPLFWALFSGGGMLAALFLPALAVILWLAWPLGWLEPPAPGVLAEKLRNPTARLALFGLVSLSLFHWGHRFRYTLYDGLQLKHLFGLIAFICYGGAAGLSLLAAWLLLTLS